MCQKRCECKHTQGCHDVQLHGVPLHHVLDDVSNVTAVNAMCFCLLFLSLLASECVCKNMSNNYIHLLTPDLLHFVTSFLCSVSHPFLCVSLLLLFVTFFLLFCDAKCVKGKVCVWLVRLIVWWAQCDTNEKGKANGKSSKWGMLCDKSCVYCNSAVYVVVVEMCVYVHLFTVTLHCVWADNVWWRAVWYKQCGAE